MNIAILSPARINETETFILAHKEKIKANIKFVYNGVQPKNTEDKGSLLTSKALFNCIVQKKLQIPKVTKKECYHEGLKHYLQNNKIHAVFAEYGLTAAINYKVLQRLNIPLVTMFHGYDAYLYNILNDFKDDYLGMFEYANTIFAVSNDMKQQLISLSAPEHIIKINPYGAREKFYSYTPNYHQNQFIFIGRFVDKKTPEYLLFAFKDVVDKYSEAKLVMIGDGPLLSASKNIAKCLNIENSVHFTGRLNHDELKNYIETSFCYVQHSVRAENGDSEGTPVSILEASASALPVVSTFHAGIKESVQHEKTGFLVEEHNWQKMKNYMISLYEDRKLAAKMGRNAREYVKNNYNIENHIKLIQFALEQAIKK